MPPPRKKTACGAVCPQCGNNFRHRDALRRSSGTAGQKLPDEGSKTAPGEGRGLCAGCAHGETVGNEVSGAGKHRTGLPAGTEGTPGTKTAPGEAGSCAQAAPTGERQATGVSGAEKHHTGHPPGQRAYPAQKQPPAEAGGCLDAGYECYLPRAIRVIWMHRVGSTARPRIMPS